MVAHTYFVKILQRQYQFAGVDSDRILREAITMVEVGEQFAATDIV